MTRIQHPSSSKDVVQRLLLLTFSSSEIDVGLVSQPQIFAESIWPIDGKRLLDEDKGCSLDSAGKKCNSWLIHKLLLVK
jgi:hypothetical protein